MNDDNLIMQNLSDDELIIFNQWVFNVATPIVCSLSEKNNPIKDDNSLTGKNDSVPQSSNMRGIVAGIAAVSLILLLFYVLATYRRQQLRRRRKKRHTKRHDR